MPETDHFAVQPNALHDRLGGKLPLRSAASLFRFHKGSLSQSLIHQIKYGGHGYLAKIIGRYIGLKMKYSSFFQDIDGIIPVPLSRRKLTQRGFNQSFLLAKGISTETGIHVLSTGVKRIVHTSSQTGLSRFERIQNLSHAFRLNENKRFNDCHHLLIVDDVLTTGATIESCCLAITKRLPEVQFSVVTVCLAI